MSNPKVGLIAVASLVEAGSDKAEERLNNASTNLKKAGLEVVIEKRVIMSHVDAIEASTSLDQNNVDLVVVLHGTWVADSIQLAIARGIGKPIVLWALPYAETYSLASVQHFASLLKHLGFYYNFVYGEPDSVEAANKIVQLARVSSVVNFLQSARIGVVGSFRSTWRSAGPTDITYDEVDLTDAMGPEIIQIDINELLSAKDSVEEAKAEQVVDRMKKSKMLVKLKARENTILEAAKAYVAVKSLCDKYRLDALTLKCYPHYPGLVCLASSLLVDEARMLGCEGDIAHTILGLAIQKLSNGSVVLAEPVKVDEKEDTILLRHCGNLPRSMASKETYLMPTDGGVNLQGTMKDEEVTIASLWGGHGDYSMFIASAESVQLSFERWRKLGEGMLINIKFNDVPLKAMEIMENIIENYGIDHHWLISSKDLQKELHILCDMLRINTVTL